jgi:isoamylase
MAGNFKITFEKGKPSPLGATRSGDGVNFALFSERATSVTLCFFTPHQPYSFFEIPLDPQIHKTESIWHVWVKGLPGVVDYGYRIDGPSDPEKGIFFNKNLVLSDPYALSLGTSHRWMEGYPQEGVPPQGRLILDTSFDWQGVISPQIPIAELIIYEMHVRGFTQHPSSQTKHPGTFLGLIEKIPHLHQLGVNAVEFLPLQEFNECENPRTNPQTHQKLCNFWGYSSVNFFSPMNRYATNGERLSAINEFKTMVRELHRNRIEVILDVVFNHTAENNEKGPWFSFRGIDNPSYYMLDPSGKYFNFSGCGNTFNCNHPAAMNFILDALRYWVKEMHVDGFRFDLASILTRDPSGKPMEKPPLIQAINRDPILSKVKLIAEAWDAAGLYQVGSFPGEGNWAEWNGIYRDTVRRFMKGSDGLAGSFASALSGSQNIYGKEESPHHSVNFVIAHDGFSLKDLVSYDSKHNEANGENNQDGMNNNDSWNCGEEGATKNRQILQLRQTQMRNFHVALMLSLGVPMIWMGDEYGHTRNGNNNGWCHDNEMNWFLWNELKKESGFFRFYKLLIQFRKKHPMLRRENFYTSDDVEWHGTEPSKPNWDPSSRLVAFTLKDFHMNQFLYVVFNAHFHHAHLTIPKPPEFKNWFRVIDTSSPSPADFLENPQNFAALKHTYDLPPHSVLVAEAY